MENSLSRPPIPISSNLKSREMIALAEALLIEPVSLMGKFEFLKKLMAVWGTRMPRALGSV